ncbi:unnamed protein product [Caretta caretta]
MLRFAYEQLARVDGEVVEAQRTTQWPRFALNHERLYRLDRDPQTQEPNAFTSHHRMGRDNANADFLSCLGEGEDASSEDRELDLRGGGEHSFQLSPSRGIPPSPDLPTEGKRKL